MRSEAGPVFHLLQVLQLPPHSAGPARGSWPGALINYRSPRSRACYARLAPVKACTSEPVLSSGVREGAGKGQELLERAATGPGSSCSATSKCFLKFLYSSESLDLSSFLTLRQNPRDPLGLGYLNPLFKYSRLS